ncbi:MAG: 50S ribosomal protein L11 methyltransferase, partial [bacterium]
MTQWIEVQIPVTDEIEEAVINRLFELGSLGCQQFDNKVLAYFAADTAINEISRKLDMYLSELPSLGFKIPARGFKSRYLAERDWDQLWKKHLKPITISNKLI